MRLSIRLFSTLLALLLLVAACAGDDETEDAGADDTEDAADDDADDDADDADDADDDGDDGADDEDEYANYYEGKTITMVAPDQPGGGTDSLTRLVARHLPRFLDGEPNVTVENIEGAGGIIGLNAVWSDYPRDGTALVGAIGTQFFAQATEVEQVEFDLAEASWIGNPHFTPRALVIWHSWGIETIDDAIAHEEPLLFGSLSPTHTATLMPRAAARLIDGLEIDLVVGYEGSPAIYLDMEREVVMGRGASYTGFVSANPEWVEGEDYHLLLQFSEERWEGMPDVPTIYEYADPAEEDMLRGLVGPLDLSRSFFGPPDIPEPVLEQLRQAKEAMSADPEFQEEAEGLGFELGEYVGGETLESMVRDALGNPDVIATLQELLSE